MNRVIEFINNENPDILVCQEVLNGSGNKLPNNFRTIETFKQRLSFSYLSFSPAFLAVTNYGKINCGNLICSKFPIKSTETIFYDIPYRERKTGFVQDHFTSDQIKEFINTPRNLQKVKIKINSKRVNIYNTQGIWGLDGKDNLKRLKMSQTIVKEIKGKKNVILSGDFNVNSGTDSINNIKNQLQSIFKDELTTSFNMKRKTDPGYAKAVVDMIFVSQEIKAIDHYCPQVDISDHLPLVAIFEVD